MNDLLILTACSQESESADIDRLHSVQSSPSLKDGFMFFTYLRRELQGRSRQTIIVSIGMALAIALQAYLEGRGQDYIPEISREDIKHKKRENFDVPDIVDPLFEEDGDQAEFSQ